MKLINNPKVTVIGQPKVRALVLDNLVTVITEVSSGKHHYPMLLFPDPASGKLMTKQLIQYGDPSEVDAINGRHVLYSYEPNAQIVEEWKRITADIRQKLSGIVIPNMQVPPVIDPRD